VTASPSIDVTKTAQHHAREPQPGRSTGTKPNRSGDTPCRPAIIMASPAAVTAREEYQAIPAIMPGATAAASTGTTASIGMPAAAAVNTAIGGPAAPAAAYSRRHGIMQPSQPTAATSASRDTGAHAGTAACRCHQAARRARIRPGPPEPPHRSQHRDLRSPRTGMRSGSRRGGRGSAPCSYQAARRSPGPNDPARTPSRKPPKDLDPQVLAITCQNRRPDHGGLFRTGQAVTALRPVPATMRLATLDLNNVQQIRPIQNG
jgi:hypothetical protein